MSQVLEYSNPQMKVNLVINEQKLGGVGCYGFSYSFNIR